MRNNLRSLKPATHAGLALYKGLKGFEPEDKQELLQAIAKQEVSSSYKTAFENWEKALSNAIKIEATTLTPLAVGLGISSPLENGLAIHHTYGTPYLPGSAIKGLLRRAADRYGLSEEEKGVLLGEGPDAKRKSQGSASHLVYWDGWLDPKSDKPFQQDVITVHHQSYYGSRGESWPTDFDDPTPVAFLSVRPKTKFVLALSSASTNSNDWVFKAAEMLEWGLGNLGLGGKTNAGYGYFEVKLPEKPKSEADKANDIYLEFRSQIEGIKRQDPIRDAREIASKLKRYPIELRHVAVEATLKHLKNIGADDRDVSKAKALLEET